MRDVRLHPWDGSTRLTSSFHLLRSASGASLWRYFRISASTPFLRKVQRHLVNRRHRGRANHGPLLHVAERGDLLLHLAAQVPVAAAKQNVRLDADAEQFLHRVLRRLGLQFLRGSDPRHQREVNEYRVFAAKFLPHLADGFEERQRLDVAHRPADLDDRHVRAIGRNLAHGVLDLVGDVRNDLNGLAQVVAAALFQDDLLVDPAGRKVVVARERRMREALVVAQVEVGFRAVVGHKDLAVLERRHGSRVDVEVGVELHQVHAQAAALEQAADRCRGKTLA